MGNLGSVEKALRHIGSDCVITSDADVINNASGVILPGVGSFAPAMDELTNRDLVMPLIDCAYSGKPFLGICLGMQLMLEGSEENTIERRETKGFVSGLGIIPGFVRRFPNNGLKVPQMGWNSLTFRNGENGKGGLFDGLHDEDFVYFVHSYYVPLHEEYTIATAHFTLDYSAALRKGNFYATQFHPEKSGKVGEMILRNFMNINS